MKAGIGELTSKEQIILTYYKVLAFESVKFLEIHISVIVVDTEYPSFGQNTLLQLVLVSSPVLKFFEIIKFCDFPGFKLIISVLLFRTFSTKMYTSLLLLSL